MDTGSEYYTYRFNTKIVDNIGKILHELNPYNLKIKQSKSLGQKEGDNLNIRRR